LSESNIRILNSILHAIELPKTVTVLGRLCVEIEEPRYAKIKKGVFEKHEYDNDLDVLYIYHNGKFYKTVDGELKFGSRFKGHTVGEHMGNGWYRMHSDDGDVIEVSKKSIVIPERYTRKGRVSYSKSNVMISGVPVNSELRDFVLSEYGIT